MVRHNVRFPRRHRYGERAAVQGRKRDSKEVAILRDADGGAIGPDYLNATSLLPRQEARIDILADVAARTSSEGAVKSRA